MKDDKLSDQNKTLSDNVHLTTLNSFCSKKQNSKFFIVRLMSWKTIEVYFYPGVTSLMGAVWEGHTDIVMLLIENGAGVNLREKTYG